MEIIAHRGNDGIHKANTLEAILASLNSKYTDGVEFDIRLTKDGKFIVCHDLFYYGHFIKRTNIKKLQKHGLNTLEEVISNINSDKIILIEVKEEGKKVKKIAYNLNKVLKKYNLNYYICSFNYDFVKYFHNRYNFKTGLIIGMNLNLNHIDNDFDFNSISTGLIKKVNKKETFIWTVNDPKIANKDMNVITDEAKKIYDYFKKNS